MWFFFHLIRAAHWYSKLYFFFKSSSSFYLAVTLSNIYHSSQLTFSGGVTAFTLHCSYNASLILMKQSKLEGKHSRVENGWITAVGWKTSCAFLAGPRSECVSFISLSSRQWSITETGPVILMSKQCQQQGNIVFGYETVGSLTCLNSATTS